ncbi:MAG TPA: 4-oxalocrotonate tautomerase DmpI [Caproicibacter sp.]|nr:4-oxalocrotonate tautomerase DmpI [Caproicibacter sp.]
MNVNVDSEREANKMPLISIESGELTNSQKEDLIKRLTEAASEITHIPSEFFMVTIKELPDHNIGIGGKTIDKIKSEYSKKS